MSNIWNLKLGYGGTKKEMLRLLADAEKISGIHYDINNLSDVYNAIHVIQGELGITGTTALEAKKTITGSANAMKSAWQNFLTGLANGNADLTSLMDNVIDSAMTLADNILPVIEKVADSVVEILPKLLDKIIENLPKFLEAGVKILNSLIEGLSSNMGSIIEAIFQILQAIVNAILQNLPTILQMGIQLIIELAKGIAQALPTLIPQIIECLLTMVNTLLDNIDMIIDAGIELVMGLIEGIVDAIPILVDKAPEIIEKIIMALANNLPKIVMAGFELSLQLALGIVKAIPKIVSKIPEIVASIVKGFGTYFKNFFEIGKNVIGGIIKGIADFDIGSAIKNTCKKMLNGIKSFFGIHSPSKLMQEEVGKFLPMGISKGFEKEIPNTIKQVDRALSELNNGIQTNINPTINPQANSNPLILQIENFNNQRNTDIQALAEELEFYRKNSSLAVGGR